MHSLGVCDDCVAARFVSIVVCLVINCEILLVSSAAVALFAKIESSVGID